MATTTDNTLKPLREHALALLLLADIQANEPTDFRANHAAFTERFPSSAYLPLLSAPLALMRTCPRCQGRSARKANCAACKNTGLCALCTGTGKRKLLGMRRTRRVPLYDIEDDPQQRTYDSSGRSRYRRTGTHSTRNYRGTTLIVENDDRDIACHRCRGTGQCLTCAEARRGVRCDDCRNTGAVPDRIKLSKALAGIAQRGRKAAQALSPAERRQWEQTRRLHESLPSLRLHHTSEAILANLRTLLTASPEGIQRAACERLAAHLADTQRKAEAERQSVKADTEKLTQALADAAAEKGHYRRRERLMRLRPLYPKASNRAELEAALTLCKDNIEREEHAIRNALRLLETVENPRLGLQQADALLREMAPISPLIGTVQSVRADLIERQRKADRNRHIAYAVIGLVILLLIYFLFDLLNGIWQTKRRRW